MIPPRTMASDDGAAASEPSRIERQRLAQGIDKSVTPRCEPIEELPRLRVQKSLCLPLERGIEVTSQAEVASD